MGDMVEVKPGTWLRSSVALTVTDPTTGVLVVCPRCQHDEFVVQPDARLKCPVCGLLGRAT